MSSRTSGSGTSSRDERRVGGPTSCDSPPR
jgi:hypothetical protein